MSRPPNWSMRHRRYSLLLLPSSGTQTIGVAITRPVLIPATAHPCGPNKSTTDFGFALPVIDRPASCSAPR